jgi:UDP-N-acetylglucosamine--N-acetylmuramyl-(pentapeptide) pyrophosphoryl-undecaprenol N-acetylglucosamine transferase
LTHNVVIAAGGTGGHISPGIALAEYLYLNKEIYNIQSIYIHSLVRNKDNPDLIDSPVPIIWHDIPQFNFKSIFIFYKYIYYFFSTFIKFNTYKIDCIIAMGGYSCIPSLLYAILFRKKIYLCEQNRIIGKVIRSFNTYADKIAFSFPPINYKKSPKTEICISGNPLRSKIYPVNKDIFIKNKNLSKKDKINALVMGGSQGARQINNILLSIMDNPEIIKNFNFRLLSGTNLYDETKERTKNPVDIISYSQDMKTHYEWANLVIARAGAGVISECVLHALPVILIPYPYAADNHQAENAKFCEDNYGFKVLYQTDEDNTEIVKILLALTLDKNKLSELSMKSLEGARPNATKDTVDFFFGNTNSKI